MKQFSAVIILCSLVAGCAKSQSGGTAQADAPLPGQGASPSSGAKWFKDESKSRGVDFALSHGGRSPLTILEEMAPGCALADFDGDGNLDFFIVGPDHSSPNKQSKLYRNSGNGKFEDVTAGSGLELTGNWMGSFCTDLDNDGRVDLLLTGYGQNKLFKNRGGFKFTDVTSQTGLEANKPEQWYSAAAFGDFDRDGLLDLYIGKYVEFTSKTIQFCDYGEFKASCGPIYYDPQVGHLYRNLGGMKFKDVTQKMGVSDAHGKCLGAQFADVNDDGWPDLYLANDEMPGDIYINQGGKKFKSMGQLSGATVSANGEMHGAMGIDFGDVNRDLKLDLVITTYHYEPTALLMNRGEGMFDHAADQTIIGEATRQMVGFGTKFVDLNNDGWLDLPIANGHIHDNQEKIDKFSTYKQSAQLFMGLGKNGFEDAGSKAGLDFTLPMVGRGLALGDIDNDGKQDLVLADAEGSVRLLMNRIPNTGSWLRVKLAGIRSNRFGIGARIIVTSGSEKYLAECTTGGSYFSSSDPRVHMGLGNAPQVNQVEVRWPSGKMSLVKNPKINSEIVVTEPQ